MHLSRHRARSARRMFACERGVTSIEFAIIAPVLILMFMGIIEFSMIMLVSNIMEASTTISSRLGKTGYTESGKSRSDTILDSIKDRAGVLIDPDNLVINSKFYEQFDEIGDAEPWNDANGNSAPDAGEWTDVNGNGVYDSDMGTAGYGNADDIVVYEISYPWEISTPIMDQIVGDGGVFTITTHAVVKNEPY